MSPDNRNKSWMFRLGVFLILFSIPFFLVIALIPFLNSDGRTKLTLSTIALIVGEVTFWAGGLLVGKEVFKRYKKYMNPVSWLKKKPEFKLTNTADLPHKIWSGGITRQLYIYPDGSDYLLRNFDFRISTSTIADEESTFTHLPGISRTLMVLDGEITIKHDNKEAKTLRKFETCSFKGDWNTKSVGKGTDFNIMTTENFSSDLSFVQLSSGGENKLLLKDKGQWLFIFVVSGLISVHGSPIQNEISAGSLLTIKSTASATIEISALADSELVLAAIYFK